MITYNFMKQFTSHKTRQIELLDHVFFYDDGVCATDKKILVYAKNITEMKRVIKLKSTPNVGLVLNQAEHLHFTPMSITVKTTEYICGYCGGTGVTKADQTCGECDGTGNMIELVRIETHCYDFDYVKKIPGDCELAQNEDGVLFFQNEHILGALAPLIP